MEWRAYCPCHASLGTWTADSFEKIRQSVVAHIRIAHPSEFAAVVRRNNVKRKLIDHLQNGAPADDETLAVLYELQKACAGKVLSDGLAKLGFTG